MSEKRTFVIDTLSITLDESRCIKSLKCCRQMPEVFKKGDPIELEFGEDVDIDKLIEAINGCPSGALTWEYMIEGDAPPTHSHHHQTTIRCIPNGPLQISGEVHLEKADGSIEKRQRLSLCRCGHSKEKPYCDGSHDGSGFIG